MKKFSLTLLFVTCLYVNSLFGASSMPAQFRDAIAECIFLEAESNFNKARALGENPKPVHVAAWAKEPAEYSALKAMPKKERQKKQCDFYIEAMEFAGRIFEGGAFSISRNSLLYQRMFLLNNKASHNLFVTYKNSSKYIELDLRSYEVFYTLALSGIFQAYSVKGKRFVEDTLLPEMIRNNENILDHVTFDIGEYFENKGSNIFEFVEKCALRDFLNQAVNAISENHPTFISFKEYYLQIGMKLQGALESRASATNLFNKARALGENPKPVHVAAWANEQQDYSALKAMPKVERQKKQHDLYLKAINNLGGFDKIGQPELLSCRTSPEQRMTLKEKIVHNLYTIYKDSHQQLKVDLSAYSDFYKTAILFSYYKFHLLDKVSLYDVLVEEIIEISEILLDTITVDDKEAYIRVRDQLYDFAKAINKEGCSIRDLAGVTDNEEMRKVFEKISSRTSRERIQDAILLQMFVLT